MRDLLIWIGLAALGTGLPQLYVLALCMAAARGGRR